MGICLPIWGKKQGEVCYRDNDCESGFVCLDSANGFRSCQAPIPGDAKLGEDCRTSSDCNINRGLCCKLQRRARSQPKKVCTYFMDPDTCIGPVATSQVLSAIEHTAGEKRISGHPDDFLRLK
ncbi:prohormone-3-like [Lepeophtheirus salmonis]|nr:prohormone-3-like [Lepeophtheirus salmonis]